MGKFKDKIVEEHKQALELISKAIPDNLAITDSYYLENRISYLSRNFKYDGLNDEITKFTEVVEDYSGCVYYFLDGLLVKLRVNFVLEEHLILNLDEYLCEEVTIVLAKLSSFKLINTKGVKTNLIYLGKESAHIDGEFDVLVKVSNDVDIKVKAKETKYSLLKYVNHKYLESITKFDVLNGDVSFKDKVTDIVVNEVYSQEIHKQVMSFPKLKSMKIMDFNGYSQVDYGDMKLKSVAVKNCICPSFQYSEYYVDLYSLPLADKYVIENFVYYEEIKVNIPIKSLKIKTLGENPCEYINKITFKHFPSEELIVGSHTFKFADKSLKTKSARSIYRK